MYTKINIYLTILSIFHQIHRVKADYCLSGANLSGIIIASSFITLTTVVFIIAVTYLISNKRQRTGIGAKCEGAKCDKNASYENKSALDSESGFDGSEKIDEMRKGIKAMFGKDTSELGFDIIGCSSAIYINKVHENGPAAKSKKIFIGDRIQAVTISFERMKIEDAFAILYVASEYKINLELERAITEDEVGGEIKSILKQNGLKSASLGDLRDEKQRQITRSFMSKQKYALPVDSHSAANRNNFSSHRAENSSTINWFHQKVSEVLDYTGSDAHPQPFIDDVSVHKHIYSHTKAKPLEETPFASYEPAQIVNRHDQEASNAEYAHASQSKSNQVARTAEEISRAEEKECSNSNQGAYERPVPKSTALKPPLSESSKVSKIPLLSSGPKPKTRKCKPELPLETEEADEIVSSENATNNGNGARKQNFGAKESHVEKSIDKFMVSNVDRMSKPPTQLDDDRLAKLNANQELLQRQEEELIALGILQ